MNSQTDFTPVDPLGQSSSVSSADAVYSQGVQVPPCGNTGVVVTSARVGLDYLRFTIPSNLADGLCCSELLSLLMLDTLPLVIVQRRGGFMGWLCSATLGPGAVLAWGGNADTACIDLTGGALGYLAAVGLDVWGWASFMLELGCRPTRVDIALDDESGYITPERVLAADEAGGIVTRAQICNEIRQRKGGRGWTYYIGSRSSEVFVRIYDKSAELGMPSEVSWMRLEVEYKGRKAAAVLAGWRSAGFAAAFALSVVRDAVDFRQASLTDSNVSRWALLDWWAAIVQGAPRVRVVVGSITRTIENVAGWLHRSVSGALAAFHAVYGADSVRQLLSHGYERMSADHRRMVALASG